MRGGKRPGAGRKKGMASIKAEEARAYLVKRVVGELDPILTAQIEAAKGMYVEKTTDDGVVLVFKKAPDASVARNLIDQTIGRAKETMEVKGDVVLKLDW